MSTGEADLPVMSFAGRAALHAWLEQNHASSPGMWLRIFKKSSGVPSVPFEDVLDEGLCFGWSESLRRRADARSYLQRFTPRRKPGTASPRNLAHAVVLMREGRMKPAGRKALGLP